MYKIGYYVNNHGIGHLNRLYCLDKELRSMNIDYKLYVFAEHIEKVLKLDLNPSTEFIRLPEVIWDSSSAHMAYHCLPIDYKEYFSPIVKSCIDNNIHTFVSDLSVEVALAVRLHVNKLIYILLHGSRTDVPHKIICKEADKVIVPFSVALTDYYLQKINKETSISYSGGFTKLQYESQIEEYPMAYCKDRKNVLIILGTGGHNFTEDYIDVDTAKYNVVLLGVESPNFKSYKFTNPYNYLRCADVVVANAGDSIVHEVSYFNKPYICIPEERPFEEQMIKAKSLKRLNFAKTSSWSKSLKEDLETLEPQTNKKTLIQNDKARLYANEILNC